MGMAQAAWGSYTNTRGHSNTRRISEVRLQLSHQRLPCPGWSVILQPFGWAHVTSLDARNCARGWIGWEGRQIPPTPLQSSGLENSGPWSWGVLSPGDAWLSLDHFCLSHCERGGIQLAAGSKCLHAAKHPAVPRG